MSNLSGMVHIEHGAETPNQRRKQQQIIDAARGVLAGAGLAGCTARAVADASPLTKSAMHYYFRDIDEVIDLAMDAHLDALLTSLREVADREPDPARKLWRVVDAYLDTFARQPHAALLWFEYWIAVSRTPRPGPDGTGPVADNLTRIRGLLRELLLAAQHPRPAAAAGLILSWLLGAVVQQDATGQSGHLGRRELQQLIELP